MRYMVRGVVSVILAVVCQLALIQGLSHARLFPMPSIDGATADVAICQSPFAFETPPPGRDTSHDVSLSVPPVLYVSSGWAHRQARCLARTGSAVYCLRSNARPLYTMLQVLRL